MRKFLALLLMSFIGLSCMAESDSIIVKVKANKEKDIFNRKFYISNVVDNRNSVITHVGEIKGFGSLKTNLILEDSLRKVIQCYVGKIFPEKSSQLPVNFQINKLQCSNEKRFSYVSAIVYAEVCFFRFEPDGGKEILLELNLSKERQRWRITGNTYADLIKQIIEEAFAKMNTQIN